jgi:hypothetical protein
MDLVPLHKVLTWRQTCAQRLGMAVRCCKQPESAQVTLFLFTRSSGFTLHNHMFEELRDENVVIVGKPVQQRREVAVNKLVFRDEHGRHDLSEIQRRDYATLYGGSALSPL